jgi:hypothetical protein
MRGWRSKIELAMRDADEIPDDELTKHSIVGAEIRLWCEVAVAWLVLDCARARRQWDCSARFRSSKILEEIAQHAEAYPEWLDVSGCYE